MVGDYVKLSLNAQDEYEILEMVPRKNEVFRRIVRERKKKVIASNIDLLCIVMSASLPEYKRGLVDRYLLRASQWNIPAIVILNKMDQFDSQFEIEFEVNRFKNLNVECYEISSTKTDYQNKFLPLGIADLKLKLENQTTIFMGQSGVGKSKLISKISGGEFELLSGDLAKVGKGAHTTSWAEIIGFDNFDLVDSPGVRSLSIGDIEPQDLPLLMPDLSQHFNKCKFSNCHHQLNSKGCYFQTLDPQNLEDMYVLTRLDSYNKFTKEVEEIPEWDR